MLKKVKIENFQSHKKSELEFDEGLNVIIGTSDSGKSAIIRSLKKVITNRPSGDDFRSDWGGETSIKIDTEEGNEITFKQDKSKEYILNELPPFKAIGQDVPSEIQTALNIDEVNTQFQHDTPFLLTKTPGEVANYFNKIANLEKINIGQSNTKKWINAINSTINNKLEDLKKKQDELIQYENIDEIETKLEVLESLESIKTQYAKALNDLEKLLSAIYDVDYKLEQYMYVDQMEEDVNALIELVKTKNEIKENLQNLSDIVNSIKSFNRKLAQSEKILSLESKVDSVIALIKSRESVEDDHTILGDILFQIETISNSINKQEKLLTEKEKEFHDNFPETCPLCGK